MSDMYFYIFLGAVAVGLYLLKSYLIRELYWQWDNGADGRNEERFKIDVDDMAFPVGFLWGTATAAHQVEGKSTNNNWSKWEDEKDPYGNPTCKDKCEDACDHWNQYKKDIALMRDLGCNAYRFSIEWSKLEPEENVFDNAAMLHYHDVIDEVIQSGMKVMVTLHHFTEPLWFVAKGGFEVAANVELFAKFAQAMYNQYGSKVDYWCTINEPAVYVTGGWAEGNFPPGKKNASNSGNVLLNLLMAHCRAYEVMKSEGNTRPVGIVKHVMQFDPYNVLNPLDHVIANLIDSAFNESVIEFFRSGRFNFSMPGRNSVSFYHAKAPSSCDFVGVNYYSHMLVKFVPNFTTWFRFRHPEGALVTDMPYSVYPEGLYRAVKRIGSLGKPVFVTENGIADARDDRRHIWIRRYLYALSRAIREGVDVRGYFYWTLMDNFEWDVGYSMKFGLYENDRKTQKRRLRDGSKIYQHIVKTHRGLPVDSPASFGSGAKSFSREFAPLKVTA